MNSTNRPNDYGELIEPTTLRIQRLLPGPIERIWAYLTDSDLRSKWLAAGAMEMKVGAPVELVWRNDELNDPPAKRPEGFPEEHRMQSRITELDPLRKLSITWNNSGDPSLAGKVNWIDAVVKLSPAETTRLLAEYHPVATDRQPMVQKILQSELPDGPYLTGPELDKHFSNPGMSTQAFLDRDQNVLVLTAASGARGLS